MNSATKNNEENDSNEIFRTVGLLAYSFETLKVEKN